MPNSSSPTRVLPISPSMVPQLAPFHQVKGLRLMPMGWRLAEAGGAINGRWEASTDLGESGTPARGRGDAWELLPRPALRVARGDAERGAAAALDFEHRADRLARRQRRLVERHRILRYVRDRAVGADEDDVERAWRVLHPEARDAWRPVGGIRPEQHAVIVGESGAVH